MRTEAPTLTSREQQILNSKGVTIHASHFKGNLSRSNPRQYPSLPPVQSHIGNSGPVVMRVRMLPMPRATSLHPLLRKKVVKKPWVGGFQNKKRLRGGFQNKKRLRGWISEIPKSALLCFQGGDFQKDFGGRHFWGWISKILKQGCLSQSDLQKDFTKTGGFQK